MTDFGLTTEGNEAVEGGMAPGRVSRLGSGQRRWTEAEKAQLVAESRVSGAMVAGVAARHRISSWSLSRWRSRAREGLFRCPGRAGRRRASFRLWWMTRSQDITAGCADD